MLLKALDRLILQSLLPKESDFLTMRIIHDLRMALSFSEAEFAALDFKEVDDQVRWNTGADRGKEIAIGDRARGVIVDALRKLEKDKKLTTDHLSVYEAFIGTGDDA